jgi:hypothetical protein
MKGGAADVVRYIDEQPTQWRPALRQAAGSMSWGPPRFTECIAYGSLHMHATGRSRWISGNKRVTSRSTF